MRSTAVNPDPRLEKEVTFLTKEYEVTILAWDRGRECPAAERKDGYTIYRSHIKGRYGAGITNLRSLIGWWLYELVWLLRHNFDIVHACDFDTYPPALLVAKLKRKKIIYDIFDFYAEMVLHVPSFVKKLIKKIDLFLIRFADAVIIADDMRKKQLKDAHPKRLITIYNTPLDVFEGSRPREEDSPKNGDFILGYIGLLKRERGLDQMIEVVNRIQNARLIIGGYGADEAYLREKIKDNPRITFLGRVTPYQKTLEILSASDALLAFYDPRISLHKSASPNKLFEAMMLGKPIIINRGIGADEIVEQYKCGLVVAYDNIDQIKVAVKNLIENKKNGDDTFGKNGRAAYLNVFNPKIAKKRLLDLYNKIVMA